MKFKNTVTFYNGYECPLIGMGTWQARDYQLDDKKKDVLTSPPGEVTEAVKQAIDIGYRHIDGAHVYGNEKQIGEALRQKFKEGVVKREDVFITSKLWCTFHRPDLVEGAIRTTLNDLGLDYLDLYLIHWPQAYKEGSALFPKDINDKVQYSDVDYVDTWKAMESLVQKGLTRSIGLSNFNRKQIERVLAVAKVKPAVLQIEVHPYLNQIKLTEFAKSKGIAVTAFSPLGSPDRPWAKPGDPHLLQDPRLKGIAERYNKTPAQVLLRYGIDRGMIVIPKSVNKDRLVQNFDVFDFNLTPEDLRLIGTFECNGRFCSMYELDHKYYPFHEEY